MSTTYTPSGSGGGGGGGGGESLDQTLAIGKQTDDDIEFILSTVGIILRAPNGDRIRVTVDDVQQLVTQLIP